MKFSLLQEINETYQPREPHKCSDPKCDGEITYNETQRDYECMKCEKPAAPLKENFTPDELQEYYEDIQEQLQATVDSIRKLEIGGDFGDRLMGDSSLRSELHRTLADAEKAFKKIRYKL